MSAICNCYELNFRPHGSVGLLNSKMTCLAPTLHNTHTSHGLSWNISPLTSAHLSPRGHTSSNFTEFSFVLSTPDLMHNSCLALPVIFSPRVDIWLNRYPSSVSFLVTPCPVVLHKSAQREGSSSVSSLRSGITSNP